MEDRYIVIEDFCGEISLVTDIDGNVEVFSNPNDAARAARLCQNGKVMKL